MTPEERRFMRARQRVEQVMVTPAQELLAATSELVDSFRQRAKDAEALLEQMRPVWAQGFTSDSEAAQANGNALSQLWQALGATNQTEAMERLHRALIAANRR